MVLLLTAASVTVDAAADDYDDNGGTWTEGDGRGRWRGRRVPTVREHKYM